MMLNSFGKHQHHHILVSNFLKQLSKDLLYVYFPFILLNIFGKTDIKEKKANLISN